MKLTTEYGELPLPEDMEISIEETHPAFSTEGTSSIPITITATAQALAALKQPTRLGSANRLRKVAATLSEGVYHKNGQLIIDSASADGGITCAFSYAEGDFYAQHKDKRVRDVMNQVEPIYTFSDVDTAYTHVMRVYKGQESAPYTVCPVAVDMQDGMYSVNNRPLSENALEYKSRYLQAPGSDVRTLVPDGYGIAPFLYLHKLLEKLFSSLGYDMEYNVFEEDSELQKIILLHNLSDILCASPLTIKYSDMSPDITMSELLDWLFDKFLAFVVVDNDKMSVGIYLLQEILESKQYDLDLSNRFDGHLKFSFNDTSRVVIHVDTSLEGATSPNETLEEFVKHNPILTEADEELFADGEEITKFILVKRLSTGEFYAFAKSVDEEITDYSSVRVGSSYFSFDEKKDSATEDFSPADLMPPMVWVNDILMPYVGSRTHKYTKCTEEKDDSVEQKIIIAYDAGYRSSGYRLATTQKYDEKGVSWIEHSLNVTDIYERFFSLYDGLLHGGKVEVSGKMVLSTSELLNWEIDVPKFCNGQLLLCLTKRYSLLHGKIKNDTSSFLLLKNVENLYTPPTFETQTYYWKLNLSHIQIRLYELCDEYQSSYAYGSTYYNLPTELLRPMMVPRAGSRIFLQTTQVVYRFANGPSYPPQYMEVTEDTELWYEAFPIQ